MLTRSFCVLVLLSAAGCSSDNGGSGLSGVVPWNPGEPCPKNRIALEGELSASSVEVNVPRGTYEYNQGTDPKTFAGAVANGSINLDWTELLPYGQTATANGKLVLPTGAPYAGTPLCTSKATVTPLEGEWDFTLTDLADCNGGAPLGTIQGCVQTL